ncbi:hypothetical protein DL89DRAFT_89604 [Linderina pennispora]|uniref:Uncharacterized protein n=1 Tax=Linderina pennispora TaxID=61395 RepID=A0A1Y1WI80_9FUNG|nr:uncharacterized protein DL89DRAFT_89604 [Linderina pennispora]ORX73182.1 hypothetical protein DL89DRAFT_89604 [Linderina pennispora]
MSRSHKPLQVEIIHASQVGTLHCADVCSSPNSVLACRRKAQKIATNAIVCQPVRRALQRRVSTYHL